MRIVVAHNYYGAKASGGESVVFQQEVDLLRRFGHEVQTIEHENAEISHYSLARKLTTPLSFGFSREIYNESCRLFRQFKPEIVHVHNYKFVLTPAIFQAAKESGAKTVLTLHNYRLVCPGGQFRRGDHVCEECLSHDPIRVLWRSKCASTISSRFLQYLFWRETYRPLLENVDVFVALSQFAKSKFVEGGIPVSKIQVKPNFVFDPTFSVRASKERSGAIFVGRLAAEKGVRFLIDAWKEIDFPLTVVGGGPEESWATSHASKNVSFVGERSRQETLELIRRSEFLVFPSVWYEGLPMTLLEACALGTPSIASDLGARRETIQNDYSGLLFPVNDKSLFISAVQKLHDDRELRVRLGEGARQTYEKLYAPERNIELLESIYRQTLETR